jgi:hypothetical protein
MKDTGEESKKGKEIPVKTVKYGGKIKAIDGRF